MRETIATFLPFLIIVGIFFFFSLTMMRTMGRSKGGNNYLSLMKDQVDVVRKQVNIAEKMLVEVEKQTIAVDKQTAAIDRIAAALEKRGS